MGHRSIQPHFQLKLFWNFNWFLSPVQFHLIQLDLNSKSKCPWFSNYLVSVYQMMGAVWMLSSISDIASIRRPVEFLLIMSVTIWRFACWEKVESLKGESSWLDCGWSIHFLAGVLTWVLPEDFRSFWAETGSYSSHGSFHRTTWVIAWYSNWFSSESKNQESKQGGSQSAFYVLILYIMHCYSCHIIFIRNKLLSTADT